MTKADPALNTAIAATVAADDRVRARVASFIDSVMDECEYLLRHGATPIKSTIIRTVLSASVKDVSKNTTDDEARAERRQQIDEMFAMVRAQLAVPEAPADATEDIPVNEPRAG